MAHSNLHSAKVAKNDEFYTQWRDIEKEVMAYLEYDPDVFRNKTVLLPCDDPEWSNFTKFFAQNFQRFGLKQLISTSYAAGSKTYEDGYRPTEFEMSDSQYDEGKTIKNGKLFSLTHDKTGNGRIDIDDLDWCYLDGDGDFRSSEVSALRDIADIVVTNPPFSLFREFLAWLMEAGKQFLIIGNMNAITYREVFPLLKENKVWLGNNYKINAGAMFFEIPEGIANLEQVREIRTDRNGGKVYITRVQGVRWFTNIDHGRRHDPLELMDSADTRKFGGETLKRYDNYDAIEIPLVKHIPSDYDGVMGVPISFLDKHDPDQFEILGSADDKSYYKPIFGQYVGRITVGGRQPFKRVFIRRRGAVT